MSSDRDPSRPEDPDRGLDVDAAFAEIVARWEPSPESPSPDPSPGPENQPEDLSAEQPEAKEPADPPEPDTDDDRRTGAGGEPDSLRSLFQPTWGDSLDSEASWDEEGHFVPPPPPPLPTVDPRRRLAWTGLFGAPVVALLLVALDATLPGWGAVLLVVAFVGGFGYLVATMGSSPPDDYSGDDGAVI